MTETLSTSEKYLWQYVQEHADEIVNTSIVELSEKANVSTATIVRTMKKWGIQVTPHFAKRPFEN